VRFQFYTLSRVSHTSLNKSPHKRDQMKRNYQLKRNHVGRPWNSNLHHALRWSTLLLYQGHRTTGWQFWVHSITWWCISNCISVWFRKKSSKKGLGFNFPMFLKIRKNNANNNLSILKFLRVKISTLLTSHPYLRKNVGCWNTFIPFQKISSRIDPPRDPRT